MDEQNERLLEHAWRHFAFHAQQRTTVFNFFTASAGLTLTGLFYVLATPTAPKVFGIAAGVGAAMLSLIFWKLDQRVTQLIKVGEQVSIAIEQSLPDPVYRLFDRAERLDVNGSLSPFKATWSYGRSFRLMFLVVAITGLVGAGAALRLELSAPKMPPGGKSGTTVADRLPRGHEPTAADTAHSTPAPTTAVQRPSDIRGHMSDGAVATGSTDRADGVRRNRTSTHP